MIDYWLLNLLNDWVAQSPATFNIALRNTQEMPWQMAALAFTAFWFMGQRGAVATEPGERTRLQNRQRVLLLFIALIIGYLVAGSLQIAVVRERPLLVTSLLAPIPPHVWQSIQAVFVQPNSFPSDHAVLFFVITTGAFFFDRRLGLLALLVSLYLSALRIGVGLHWPSDILAGGLIGILVTLLCLPLEPMLVRCLRPVVLQFEAHPRWAYVVGFLAMFDLSQQFAATQALLYLVTN